METNLPGGFQVCRGATVEPGERVWGAGVLIIRSRRSLISDIKWGLGWGLWLAAAFALLGAALMVMRVNIAGVPSHFAFPLVILGYLAMGLLGGVVVGLLRPLGQHQGGATLLGMIVGIIVYAIAGIVAVGVKEFRSPAGVLSALILGIVIGGLAGRRTWRNQRRKRE